MFDVILKTFSSMVLALVCFVLPAVDTAHAVSIDPGKVHFWFGDNELGGMNYGGNSFYTYFGNPYHSDPQYLSYDLNINEAAGTASLFLNGIEGRVFSGEDRDAYRDDALALADVTLDVAFTWTDLYRDADGNLVGRSDSGGGAVANLQSDYFVDGAVQFALSPKATGGNEWSQWVWGDLVTEPLFFFLGAQPENYFLSFQDTIFSAWVMANGPVSVNGSSFTVTGDFAGHANVPEPSTLLLLGSGVFLARRRKAQQ